MAVARSYFYTWYEFHSWAPRTGNPIVELEHKEVCAGSREKAQKLRSEFDVYILLFPSQLLRDFQDARPGTKEHALSLIELLARSCHQLAVLIFQLNDGVHKHALYEAWRDAPNVDPRERVTKKPPSAFSNTVYHFYEQYPNGLADVVGYWAESKIFGGVVVFDRGPSGTERREIYISHHTTLPLSFGLFASCRILTLACWFWFIIHSLKTKPVPRAPRLLRPVFQPELQG
ncbi:hypothetical protein FJTKL_10986 [Diaporthe vaccinii]|uniref:Uncharacterized protein n=1 Tax=Diaporthe vaccinii TaxID=105482 RepID=A0ABR4EIW5_9PEZI